MREREENLSKKERICEKSGYTISKNIYAALIDCAIPYYLVLSYTVKCNLMDNNRIVILYSVRLN